MVGLAVQAVAARQDGPDGRVDDFKLIEGFAAARTRHDHVDNYQINISVLSGVNIDRFLVCRCEP